MVTITHEQNISCSKTHLDGTHERTIICTQLFAGHEVGPRPFSEIEGAMHRMIIESIDCSQSPIFPRDRRCRSLSPTSRYLGLLMRAKLGREPSQPYPHPTLTHGLNPRAFCTLPSFARIKRERWRPVGLNDRHLRSQGKIRACKQSIESLGITTIREKQMTSYTLKHTWNTSQEQEQQWWLFFLGKWSKLFHRMSLTFRRQL